MSYGPHYWLSYEQEIIFKTQILNDKKFLDFCLKYIPYIYLRKIIN